jgi:hypothetical protein
MCSYEKRSTLIVTPPLSVLSASHSVRAIGLSGHGPPERMRPRALE